MTVWLTRPARFGAVAAVIWVLWLAAHGLGARQLGVAPIAQWDLAASATPWRVNPDHGWAVFGGALAVDRSPGVSVTFEPRFGGSVVVAAMWRQAGDADWHWVRFAHPLSQQWAYLDLSAEPSWTGTVHDLAIATDGGFPLTIRAVALEARGPMAEVSRAWRSFVVAELFDQFSINFLYGAQVNQVTWSVPIMLALALFALLQLVVARRRRQPLDWSSLIALALAAWVVLDLRFTADLAANARADVTRFPVIANADAVVANDDPLFAELVDAVRRAVPEHATIALYTDADAYMNKAQYVLFPRIVANWSGRKLPPLYAMLYHRPIRFDAASGLLTLAGAPQPARLIARPADDAAVFEMQWDRLPKH